ncbi:CidA/LrgA family protein [Rhizobium puerariae]|uniref:CidA/LrgA family protein n=1 Tax=Rhizobium puerariae TaxID=1585791 RepID=A0ABV6APK5_9HYPH
MFKGLAVLLVFQLTGEIIAFGSHLPIPGPVLGMILLIVCLRFRTSGRLVEDIERTSSGLLSNLGLFFVPAGVGIMAMVQTVQSEGIKIGFILIASTFLTLIVSVWIFIQTRKVVERHRETQ